VIDPATREAQDRLGGNIRRHRIKAGQTQQELADRCELPEDEIVDMEQGGGSPTASTIYRLCGGLSISADALFDGIRWNAETRDYDIAADQPSTDLLGEESDDDDR
jgi:transcriptional regulator with XRE-family HTH domain